MTRKLHTTPNQLIVTIDDWPSTEVPHYFVAMEGDTSCGLLSTTHLKGWQKQHTCLIMLKRQNRGNREMNHNTTNMAWLK